MLRERGHVGVLRERCVCSNACVCVCPTLSWSRRHVGLELREGGALGVQQEVVKELHLLLHLLDLVPVFIQDVLTHKLWSLLVNTAKGQGSAKTSSTETHLWVH